MYHQHYRLSGAPFRFTPTPDALYLGKTHREALAALEFGLLREPSGFTMLVGESGVGKTTLVCSLLARRYESVRAAFITNLRLNVEQILRAALTQIAPGVRGRDKFELTENFVRQLDDLAPGQRVALILDEAQELSDETLEELRLLSNFDAGAEHRLQLIFVGQTELIERLESARMRSLNERIGARALLRPLTPAEAREYVDCRLRAKGGTARAIFAPKALKYLMAHGRGIPRRINVLSHNAMLLGYAASSSKVTLAMARNAVSDYEDLLGSKQKRAAATEPARAVEPIIKRPRHFALQPVRWAMRAALAASLLLLFALGAIYLQSAQTPSASPHQELAIRPAAGSKTTGPRIPLRPVASAAERSGAKVVNAIGSELRRLDLSPIGAAPKAGAGAGAEEHKSAAGAYHASAASLPSVIRPDSGSDAVPRGTAGSPSRDATPGSAGPAHKGEVSESARAVPAPGGPRSIQVRAGETMWAIALRYLGSAARLGQLIRANPQLHNADRIYPGETLHLPPNPAVADR